MKINLQPASVDHHGGSWVVDKHKEGRISFTEELLNEIAANENRFDDKAFSEVMMDKLKINIQASVDGYGATMKNTSLINAKSLAEVNEIHIHNPIINEHFCYDRIVYSIENIL